MTFLSSLYIPRTQWSHETDSSPLGKTDTGLIFELFSEAGFLLQCLDIHPPAPHIHTPPHQPIGINTQPLEMCIKGAVGIFYTVL